MCSYRELPLWQRAMDLAELIHRSTAGFPLAERRELARELRRWSLAIPLQVAEHYGLQAATFLGGLEGAQRALLRLEHLVLMAGRLEYWSAQQVREIAHHEAEVRRLLQAFLHALRPPVEP